MLELVRATVQVKLDGKEFSLRKPAYYEGAEYRASIKKFDGDDMAQAELLVSFLSKLGMPEDSAKSLESEHLEQILEFVLTAKKK